MRNYQGMVCEEEKIMWEHPLSYIVLEFFTWNPAWDQYLTKMMEERLAKTNNKLHTNRNDTNKGNDASCTSKCVGDCGGCS